MVFDIGSSEQTVCNGAIVQKSYFLEHTADDRCVLLDNDIDHIDAVEVLVRGVVCALVVSESGKSIIEIVLAAFQRQRIADNSNFILPAVALKTPSESCGIPESLGFPLLSILRLGI